ncbi:type VII toxin-antitoxin system MntA family adenylyltransferase antitoxin [Heliophilum fasciatum]|uniref:Polymerase beta nucleotidyltransferase domain-containing protein n=1 Tax=Heliophilum fasciatum TaxID=35700 RepID=A0A4R2RPU6_9FIRM|nr:nucleotidyltransferase domain-containing protein [Heliophilum fasciatum]MCW2279130.1 putative nucleotidyltransferase [Heliophilum fasciatum]TCP61215.1 hypothetical protein EDD73_1307 [Heliophilum fasciatum]
MIEDHDILGAVEQVLDVPIVYLFGSMAKGNANDQSDIDIAILPLQTFDPYELYEAREEIAEKLHRDTDLVDLSSASPIIAMQVVRHGRLLKNQNNRLLMCWIVKTIHMYDDLKRVRRPIEEALARKVLR